MAGPPYPITVEIEGRRYAGTWSLRQGGRITVGGFYGSRTVDLGRDRPEVIAPRVLKQLVELWLEKQKWPPEKPKRRRG